MRLNSVKLSGFKSFVDPTSVTFPSSMSCIVGPNGCGKSNVIDAGRWVLGESSAKNINEFVLANQLYRAIYTQYKDELDGDIIAEYAQTLFLSNERKFNDEINIILDHALQKKALNPSALTLKGLSELENNNPDSTIEYWKKAIPLLNSQKEKDELNSLIDAVKKAKNQ